MTVGSSPVNLSPRLQGNGTSTHSIAIVNSLPLANVELSAGVAAFNDVLNFGLVARYQEATGDMYVGRLVRRQNQTFAEICKIVAGQTTMLASALAGGASTSGKLTFIVAGNQLTLKLDSQTLLTTSDGAISTPGQVGVTLGTGSVLDSFVATRR